jgi:hypothetical protein
MLLALHQLEGFFICDNFNEKKEWKALWAVSSKPVTG